MLHENRYELLKEKGEQTREKAKEKRKEAKGKTIFKDQFEYMAWYRKQSQDIKDSHKLNRTDGKLIVTIGKEEKPVEKKKVAKEPEKKVVVKKVDIIHVPKKYTDSSNQNISEVNRSKNSIREGLMILKGDGKMDSGKRESIERSIKNSMSSFLL